MIIDVVKTNKEFITKYGHIVFKEEAKMQLFIANLKNQDCLLEKNAIRGAIIDDNQIKLLFLNANPFCLLLCGLNNDFEATQLLCNYIKDNNIEITGIQGNRKDYDLFYSAYENRDNLFEKISMSIMVNDSLIEREIKGKLILANNDDYDDILHCFKNFYHDCFNQYPDDAASIAFTESALSNNVAYFYVNEDNEKVSMGKLSREMNKGVAISFVYTKDEYRNKGYATEMVYLITKMIFDKGYEYATLYVDNNNPISNKVYLSVGYRYITESIEGIIKK